MKRTGNKFIFYFLGIVILSGMIYVATKNITPPTTEVEQNIPIKK